MKAVKSVKYAILNDTVTFFVPREYRRAKFCEILVERGRTVPISSIIQGGSPDLGFYIGMNSLTLGKDRQMVYSFVDRVMSVKICAALAQLTQNQQITKFGIEIVEAPEEGDEGNGNPAWFTAKRNSVKPTPSKKAYDGTPRAFKVLIDTQNDPIYEDLKAEIKADGLVHL